MHFCEKAFQFEQGCCLIEFGFKTYGLQSGDAGHSGDPYIFVDLLTAAHDDLRPWFEKCGTTL
ncbi:MAG: hypothetical protein P4L46_05480 [Fimbriimonas sp.]|nr:hypothetical protein [Fimbriimonas sp.]